MSCDISSELGEWEVFEVLDFQPPVQSQRKYIQRPEPSRQLFSASSSHPLVYEDDVPACVAYEEVQTSTSTTSLLPKLVYHPYRTFIEKPRKYARLTDIRSCKIVNLMPPSTIDEMSVRMDPDPFQPAPNGPYAPDPETRMEFSHIRIENRRFRKQRDHQRYAIKQESANCVHCHVKFFLPFHSLKSQISYSNDEDPYDLPKAFFKCPMCQNETPI